ncbi:MAG: DNA repair protein RecO [Deltaproteobacteria bacterium]|nr:DNA repair protein RecO [Deltaproteobacteria bacterium]
MNIHKTTAVILKKIPYSESDMIVWWLAGDGRKQGGFAPSARSSQKRFAGGLDLFTFVELLYQERKGTELVLLQNASLQNGMEGIRKDLPKFASACYFSEMILEFLQEKQSLPAVFGIFWHFLQTIDRPGPLAPHLIPLMEHQLLTLFGFRPSLSACGKCGKKIRSAEPAEPVQPVEPNERYFFDGRHGSILCSLCAGPVSVDSHPLSHESLTHLLKSVEANPSEWFSQGWKTDQVAQTRRAFEYFIQYTAGKPLKSLRFLSQILS